MTNSVNKKPCYLVVTNNQLLYILIALAIFLFIFIFYHTDGPAQEPNLALEKDDLNTSPTHKLLNITLKYTLSNNTLCKTSDDIGALFIITSYFGNVETRSAIRETFKVKDFDKLKIKWMFLLGEAPKDKYTTQQLINKESQEFGDILQGNFSEAYRNLTYKHVMGLQWAGIFCSKARFLIKMDDDTVINLYELNTLLNSLNLPYAKDFIAGYILRKMTPIRDPANKWYVTKEEYSLEAYPSFTSGWFYITKPETAMKLAALANSQKYFWIDDVFVTGIVANKLGISLVNIRKYFVVNSEFLQCCLQDYDKNIECEVTIGPNGGDNRMFLNFNHKARKCSVDKVCRKRSKPLNETCVAERKVNLGRGAPIVSDFRLF